MIGRWTDRAVLALATGGGLGCLPWAPGTWGTLPGVGLVVALWPVCRGCLAWQAMLAILLPLAVVPVCGRAERLFGRCDDRRIVADEWASFPLAMVGLPVTRAEWWIVPLAFAAARWLVILKPWPAGRAQRLPGGWGVIADDVAANLYALVFVHVVVAAVRRWT